MVKQNGIMLVEVVISLFIVSVALISLAQTSLYTSKHINNHYYFNIARLQADSMKEYLFLIKKMPTIDFLNQWDKSIQKILLKGQGKVQQKGANFLIQIVWNNKNMNDCKKNLLDGCYYHYFEIPKNN